MEEGADRRLDKRQPTPALNAIWDWQESRSANKGTAAHQPDDGGQVGLNTYYDFSGGRCCAKVEVTILGTCNWFV